MIIEITNAVDECGQSENLFYTKLSTSPLKMLEVQFDFELIQSPWSLGYADNSDLG